MRVSPLLLALIVAGCSREILTDAAPLIATPSAGAVSISVTGLPTQVPAPVSITGPNSYHHDITVSTTLDSLVAGDYVLHASTATDTTDTYAPAVDSVTIHVNAGSTQSVQVLYLKVAQPAASGLGAHPRVWMNASRVAQLRGQASANTGRWIAVRAAADAQVKRGAAYTSSDANLLPELCLAYLATNAASYAQRAGVILTAYSIETNDLTGDSGYNFRFGLPLATMALDWCYDGLTVAQRHQTATWLMNRADWVWPETTASRSSGWAVTNPGNNYWWGFMMSGPAALAAAGDDTGAGAVSGADRPTYHRQLALSKWNNVAVPYFATDGLGGAWLEGTGYDSSHYVGEFAEAFLTAGMPVSDPFLKASLLWRLHSTMPGGKFKATLGDQARVSNGAMFSYDRIAALDMLAPSNADATLSGQIQTWLSMIGQVPGGEIGPTATLGDELREFNPQTPAAADLSALPNGYYAPGSGYFVYRQSWTDPNSTAMVFESNRMVDHSSRDANGLMIWKGAFWISANANIYSASGIEQATVNYNNLTVGGTGQALYGGNRGIIVGAPSVSGDLVVVRGQAKDAYGYPSGTGGGRNVLSDDLRTVSYLPKQDVFVIVDRVTAVTASQTKTWRWHTQSVPEVSGNTFRLKSPSGDYSCFGTVLTPGDVTLGMQSYSIGQPVGQVSSNAVTVSTGGRATDVVVTVLQCTNAATAPFVPTVIMSPTQAVVTIGTSRVTVPLNETQAVGMETAAIIR